MLAVWVPLGLIAVVVLSAVLLVLVSVVCAGQDERSRVAVQGARELRRLVEALLRGRRP